MGIEEYLYSIAHARWGREVRPSIVNAIRQCYEDGRAGATDLTAREAIASEVTTRTSETHKQTATSTDFNLVTADGGIEVERVVGKSFKSKNLLKPTLASATTSNGVTCTPLGDGTFLVNGTASANATFYLSVPQGITAGVTYKYVGCPSGGSNTTYRGCIRYGGNDLGNGNTITYTDEQIANGIYYFCEVKSGQTVSNLIFKPMLTTDTSATYSDFTPYGIHSSGQYGCVDLGELSWSYDSGNKGFFVQMSTLARSRVALYCDDLNVIPTQFSWGSFSGYPNHSVGTALNGTLYCKYTEFTTPADLKNALKGTYLAYEYSSTPSQYAEVWEEHNNAFNGWIQGQFNTTTKVFDTSANWVRTDYLPCDKSASLLFSTDTYTDGHYKRAIFFDASKTYISDSSSQLVQKLSFTTPSNCEYVIYEIAKSSGITPNNAPTDVVMISHRKTIIFPLAEPLRSVGDVHDYIDTEKGVIVRNVGSANLGDSTWTLDSASASFFFSTDLQTSVKKGTENILCTKYEHIDSTKTTDKNIYVATSGTVGIKDTSYTDATSFKTAMNGVMLIYELATPTTQPLTAEQRNALNSFKSFAGKTIITSQDLADAKPTVTLHYGKSDAMAKAIEGVCEAKRVDATEPNNEAIADAYNPKTTYVAGDYLISQDCLYKVKVGCQGVQPPNSTYYELTSVAKELSDITQGTTTINTDKVTSVESNTIYKIGKLVTIKFIGTCTASSWNTLFTLPEAFRPRDSFRFVAYGTTSKKAYLLSLHPTTGAVAIVDSSVSNEPINFSATWITK